MPSRSTQACGLTPPRNHHSRPHHHRHGEHSPTAHQPEIEF